VRHRGGRGTSLLSRHGGLAVPLMGLGTLHHPVLSCMSLMTLESCPDETINT
jgi:hypothetical protein